jgi:hypothetical protein
LKVRIFSKIIIHREGRADRHDHAHHCPRFWVESLDANEEIVR